MKNISLRALNIVVLIGIAVCYAELVKYFMSMYYPLFQEPLPNFYKMFVTFSSAVSAALIVFTLNATVVRQSMLAVGIASGLGAFTWYYIVRGYPDILKNIVAATMSVHSLFAMLAFIMVPLIFAYALKSRFSYRGLLVLLESRRENA